MIMAIRLTNINPLVVVSEIMFRADTLHVSYQWQRFFIRNTLSSPVAVGVEVTTVGWDTENSEIKFLLNIK